MQKSAPSQKNEKILVPYSPKRWGNAQVSISTDETGRRMVVKDFGVCPLWVRMTTGRLLLWREARALRRLEQIKGIPGPPVIREGWKLKYPFVEGCTLRDERAEKMGLGRAYFEALEKMVNDMHRHNVVHLDMRNARNVLVDCDGQPALIDFQTALFTNLMPGFLKRILFSIDLAGVYKHWNKLSPQSLTRERKEAFNRMASLRGLWFIKGYPLRELFRKRHHTGTRQKRNRQKLNLDD